MLKVLGRHCDFCVYGFDSANFMNPVTAVIEDVRRTLRSFAYAYRNLGWLAFWL